MQMLYAFCFNFFCHFINKYMSLADLYSEPLISNANEYLEFIFFFSHLFRLLKNEGESRRPDRGQGHVEGQHPRAENPQVARKRPLSNRRRRFVGPVDPGPGVVSKPQWRPSL